ncbi:hypothetical protein [Synechocystis salina]|uniref:hypothetical protein n=1 Tax=Synechocystis salina TaxID=945780 RepID=UPI001D14B020|nr:hypothetical protein [Synechocystis salina]
MAPWIKSLPYYQILLGVNDGDPSSNAEAMALRRCCAKFGLGRDLWRKDKPQPLKMGQRQEPDSFGPWHYLTGRMAQDKSGKSLNHL